MITFKTLMYLLGMNVLAFACQRGTMVHITNSDLVIKDTDGHLSSNFNKSQLIDYAQKLSLQAGSLGDDNLREGHTTEASLEKSGKHYYLMSKFINSDGKLIIVAKDLKKSI